MEIERANPRLRRLAIIGIAAACLIGVAGIATLEAWLNGLASAADEEAAGTLRFALALVIAIGCASLLAVAIYLWRLGARVRHSGRFPPPGMRVLRDTPVARGSDAARRAWLLRLFAGLFVLCGSGLAAAAWRLMALFGAHAE